MGILSCLIQTLVPQGKMKKTAVFACSLVLIGFFLESFVQFFHSTDFWNVFDFLQTKPAAETYAADALYALQLTQDVFGGNTQCFFEQDETGAVYAIRIVMPQNSLPPMEAYWQKQSITRALCGIYGIDEQAIQFEQGG